MSGTSILVAVRWTERGRLVIVWFKRRHTAAAVVVVQPRLETRLVAAAARLLGPKVEVLLVEVAVVVPDDDDVVRLEEHVQALVELHVPLVLATRLGRLGAAGRGAFQRGFLGLGLAAVA